jgi:hypothetical protein
MENVGKDFNDSHQEVAHDAVESRFKTRKCLSTCASSNVEQRIRSADWPRNRTD